MIKQNQNETLSFLQIPNLLTLKPDNDYKDFRFGRDNTKYRRSQVPQAIKNDWV